MALRRPGAKPRNASRDPQAELVAVEGADHFDVIDPGHEAWAAVVGWLSPLLGADILAG